MKNLVKTTGRAMLVIGADKRTRNGEAKAKNKYAQGNHPPTLLALIECRALRVVTWSLRMGPEKSTPYTPRIYPILKAHTSEPRIGDWGKPYP